MIYNILANAPAQVAPMTGWYLFAGSIVALVLILRKLSSNVTGK